MASTWEPTSFGLLCDYCVGRRRHPMSEDGTFVEHAQNIRSHDHYRLTLRAIEHSDDQGWLSAVQIDLEGVHGDLRADLRRAGTDELASLSYALTMAALKMTEYQRWTRAGVPAW